MHTFDGSFWKPETRCSLGDPTQRLSNAKPIDLIARICKTGFVSIVESAEACAMLSRSIRMLLYG